MEEEKEIKLSENRHHPFAQGTDDYGSSHSGRTGVRAIVGRFRDWVDRSFSSLVSWRTDHVSDMPFVFILATVAGIIIGGCAALLKHTIDWVSSLMLSHFSNPHPNYYLLAIPIVGILLTGILCRYVLHVNAAHGVRQLMAGFKKHIYDVSKKFVYSPFLASTVTLGLGGSAGSEGPIATTGAAIGSNIGKLFRLSPDLLMIMVGCGAGAGIAGIFKAPVGGALFTLEVLGLPLSTVSVIALFVSCLASGLTAYVLSGCTIDITVMQLAPFDPAIILPAIVLGLFAGCYSLYYSYIMKKIGAWLTGMPNVWIKNLTGGVILASLVFIFPSLYGEGYGVVGEIINGDSQGLTNGSFFAAMHDDAWALILVATGVVAAKCFATSATNNGGGVAGDFAPTLFAGCVVGFLFAMLANKLFGLGLSASEFALFGMAGVMAGAIRAPLMAIFLVMEMTASYSLILPIVIVATLSFGVVRLFTFDNFFSRHADRRNGLVSILSGHGDKSDAVKH